MYKVLKTVFLLMAASFFSNQLFSQPIYPTTKKLNQVDEYFGTRVEDPYRWLEDDNSEETKAWVAEENSLTNQYLSAIPFRDKVKNRLEEMWNYAKYSAPFKEGSYYYYYKNDGLQNQSVLYRQRSLTGVPEIFIDPNVLSADGTAVPGVPAFSKTAKYCAYLQAQSGSDWQEAYIMDVQSKKILDEKLQ